VYLTRIPRIDAQSTPQIHAGAILNYKTLVFFRPFYLLIYCINFINYVAITFSGDDLFFHMIMCKSWGNPFLIGSLNEEIFVKK
jgi:hypothetical protein